MRSGPWSGLGFNKSVIWRFETRGQIHKWTLWPSPQIQKLSGKGELQATSFEDRCCSCRNTGQRRLLNWNMMRNSSQKTCSFWAQPNISVGFQSIYGHLVIHRTCLKWLETIMKWAEIKERIGGGQPADLQCWLALRQCPRLLEGPHEVGVMEFQRMDKGYAHNIQTSQSRRIKLLESVRVLQGDPQFP